MCLKAHNELELGMGDDSPETKWEGGNEYTVLHQSPLTAEPDTAPDSTVVHTRGGAVDACHGAFMISEGRHRIRYHVVSPNTSGYGMVMGVCDASVPFTEPTSIIPEEVNWPPMRRVWKGGRAWGFSPNTGMLVTTQDAWKPGMKGKRLLKEWGALKHKTNGIYVRPSALA